MASGVASAWTSAGGTVTSLGTSGAAASPAHAANASAAANAERRCGRRLRVVVRIMVGGRMGTPWRRWEGDRRNRRMAEPRPADLRVGARVSQRSRSMRSARRTRPSAGLGF